MTQIKSTLQYTGEIVKSIMVVFNFLGSCKYFRSQCICVKLEQTFTCTKHYSLQCATLVFSKVLITQYHACPN